MDVLVTNRTFYCDIMSVTLIISDLAFILFEANDAFAVITCCVVNFITGYFASFDDFH